MITNTPPLTLLLLLSSLFSPRLASNSIKQTQVLKDDGATLVSSDDNFALGFFSPPNSTNRYLGIWYTFSEQTVVWVANRQSPIADSTGILRFTEDTNLVLQTTNTTVWSSGTHNTTNPVATLSNFGNLLILDSSGNTKWQSIDHATDTMLEDAKVGLDLKTGTSRKLTSWKSSGDPSPGDYVWEMDRRGAHEIYLKRGDVVLHRTGPWNGIGFNGLPRMARSAGYSISAR